MDMIMGKKDLSFLKQPNHTGILDPDSEINTKNNVDSKKESEPTKSSTAKREKKEIVKKTIGRPPKSDDEKKKESVRVYFTKAEKRKLEGKANIGGFNVPLGQLIRKVLKDKDYI